jgi:hypothetical protein
VGGLRNRPVAPFSIGPVLPISLPYGKCLFRKPSVLAYWRLMGPKIAALLYGCHLRIPMVQCRRHHIGFLHTGRR